MALAKKQPGKLSYSTFSFPLVHYMDGLKKKYGVDIVRVPYRSGNEVMTALLSGATPITLLGLSNMVSTLQAERSPRWRSIPMRARRLFPAVPTLKEATGENYPQSWFGLFAPAGTPKAIVARLHKEVAAITGDPAFMQKMYIERAVEHAVDTPEAFARFIHRGSGDCAADRDGIRRAAAVIKTFEAAGRLLAAGPDGLVRELVADLFAKAVADPLLDLSREPRTDGAENGLPLFGRERGQGRGGGGKPIRHPLLHLLGEPRGDGGTDRGSLLRRGRGAARYLHLIPEPVRETLAQLLWKPFPDLLSEPRLDGAADGRALVGRQVGKGAYGFRKPFAGDCCPSRP